MRDHLKWTRAAGILLATVVVAFAVTDAAVHNLSNVFDAKKPK
jgi:hypothetical protein